MKSRSPVALFVWIAMQAAYTAHAAVPPPTEAPTGFDTPTLIANPGSQSSSNGIVEPPGDTYVRDQQVYETQKDVTTGLGPTFNARACAECHQNPVSGGASQFTELRVGHRDASGTFVNPTIPIDDGAAKCGELLVEPGNTKRRRTHVHAAAAAAKIQGHADDMDVTHGKARSERSFPFDFHRDRHPFS